MIRNRYLLGISLLLACGCTSFRTTALYRFDNDSVLPECNNRKLKGIPVKLKVPSHVRVMVFEQQLLLAEDTEAKKAKALAAQTDLNNKIQALKLLPESLSNTKQTTVSKQMELTDAKNAYDAAAVGSAEKAIAKIALEQADASFQNAKVAEQNAQHDYDNYSELLAEIEDLKTTVAGLEADASVRYQLVSFTPAQLIVETSLEYTDKVFLVDFKRPAGGVLDLKEASMDDEQYFSKIQAEIQERTLADVNTGLQTITKAIKPVAATTEETANTATPTSASTPDNQGNRTVDFQKSVVATQRFDISEPCWEERMMQFVNSRLNPQASAIEQIEGEIPVGTYSNP